MKKLILPVIFIFIFFYYFFNVYLYRETIVTGDWNGFYIGADKTEVYQNLESIYGDNTYLLIFDPERNIPFSMVTLDESLDVKEEFFKTDPWFISQDKSNYNTGVRFWFKEDKLIKIYRWRQLFGDF